MSELSPDIVARDGERAGLLGSYWARLKGGDLGSLPVVLGLIVIWLIFQAQNDRFLSPVNITNLALQITAVGTVSVGIVLVLLLGEIDLSVGYVSAVGAATMAVLVERHGWGGWTAIFAGLAVGAGIGLFQGLVITKLQVPSFIVSLAGFIAWQGVLLYVLGTDGTVNITDQTILDLTTTFFDTATSWAIGIAAVALAVLSALWQRRQRTAAELEVEPAAALAIRLAVVAVLIFGAIAVFNRDRGLPLAVVIFIGLIVIVQFMLSRTRFGRHIFAVGGSMEGARRAGIRVDGVRLMVFILCSTLAAFGGVLAASRLTAVSQSTGSGDFLLDAIAGAVIGGTSLFGGRGSAWSALLGALVIGSIANGMGLLSLDSSVQYMVTGAVLLLAVIVDSTARRGRQASGR